MKAWEIRESFGLDSLTLTERDEPTVNDDEILLRVRAVSLNYRDLMTIKGTYNPRQKLPLVPCSDAAGEVVTVGKNVTAFQPGDRAVSCFFQDYDDGEMTDAQARTTLGSPRDGVLAEYVCLKERGAIKTPAHLTEAEAACLPCAGVTAWNALYESGKLKAGDTVLLQGTGGVSIFALQFARLSGARIIITSSQNEKLTRARELGAHDTINYRQTAAWGSQAKELTGKRGVDHVVEVGGAGTFGESLQAVRRGGYIALIGVLSGVGAINPLGILMNGVRVQGIFVGSRRMFENMNRALEINRIKPVVDKTFAFDEARTAFQNMEAASHFGKIVVQL